MFLFVLLQTAECLHAGLTCLSFPTPKLPYSVCLLWKDLGASGFLSSLVPVAHGSWWHVHMAARGLPQGWRGGKPGKL